MDVNAKFFALVRWLEIGSRRTPLLIETVTNGILAGIYGYIGATDYTSHIIHMENVFNYSQRFLYQHKTLIWGSNTSTSCNNFTQRLDDLHFANTCIYDNQADSLQVNYRCMSLDQQIMTFNKFAKDAYLTMVLAQTFSDNSTNGTQNDEDLNEAFLNILNGYEMINLHYLGITYLLPKLEEAQNILNELINLKIKQLKRYSIIISLCTLAAEFVLFIIEIFIINNLKDEYNIVRILIARLPPLSVVQNQSIVELITGQSETKTSKKLSPIEIHIRSCTNSIIIFNKQCKIQLVNQATTSAFGFTKEQLYNAHLSTVIVPDDVSIIQDRLNRNNEHKGNQKSSKTKISKSSSIREDEAELLSGDDLASNNEALSALLNDNDNDDIDLNNKNNKNNEKKSNEKVDLYNDPLSITIVGMKDDETKMILSAVLTYLPAPDDVYALIMRDETMIYLNEEKIEEAKSKTLRIKDQVLPHAISQNEEITENISFSLKLVTVITIKVLNFNESMLNFTSVQAIRNMSDLFATFDSQLMNYPNLTKTLVISESYQAIGGLFNSKTVRKSLSKAEVLDEINENEQSRPESQMTTGRQENPSESSTAENQMGSSRTENQVGSNNEMKGASTESQIGTSQPENPMGNSKTENQADNQAASGRSENSEFSGTENNASSRTESSTYNENTIGGGLTFENSTPSDLKKMQIKAINSRKSIYDINSFGNHVDNFSDVILDSIYFGFNCIDAAEFVNASNGTNFILGIGINVGGPVTAGTLGKERMQFEVVGEAVKSSFIICSAAEPSTIVIAENALKFIKSSKEAQKNLIFQRYRRLNMLHGKIIETFKVRPSEALMPATEFSQRDSEDEINIEEEEIDDKQ